MSETEWTEADAAEKVAEAIAANFEEGTEVIHHRGNDWLRVEGVDDAGNHIVFAVKVVWM